jgi:hypothetical protein
LQLALDEALSADSDGGATVSHAERASLEGTIARAEVLLPQVEAMRLPDDWCRPGLRPAGRQATHEASAS